MIKTNEVGSLSKLADLSSDSPVICDVNDLEAKILTKCHGLSIFYSIKSFWQKFESPTYSFDNDVIINDSKKSLVLNDRITTYTPPKSLPVVEYTGDVFKQSLNSYISRDNLTWRDVEETLLCQSDISDRIKSKADNHDTVALVIIDGLSYVDWTSYGGDATPVYVDAPTITECGYPNVVDSADGKYGIATDLHQLGYTSKRAYTYWEKKQNDLTEELHEPFSPNEIKGDVKRFNDVIRDLKFRSVNDSTYIQITLTGPERVAHQIKEDPYIDDQVEQVKDKLSELDRVLADQSDSHLIIATSDHGILWRKHTELEVIDENRFEQHERRHLSGVATNKSLPQDFGIENEFEGTQYFRLLHPYLFSELRSNEPGVHGGYSSEESIVPLITIENQS